MKPKVDSSCYISDKAIIIGDVVIEKGCSIWPGAVLRGDLNNITVREGANVQDNCVIHVTRKKGTTIGKDTSVGHGAVIHSANIGDCCIIGMNATVLDGARIGDNCIIGAGAVVKSGMVIPSNSLVIGVPGKVVKTSEELVEVTHKNAVSYHLLRNEHREGRHETFP